MGSSCQPVARVYSRQNDKKQKMTKKLRLLVSFQSTGQSQGGLDYSVGCTHQRTRDWGQGFRDVKVA